MTQNKETRSHRVKQLKAYKVSLGDLCTFCAAHSPTEAQQVIFRKDFDFEHSHVKSPDGKRLCFKTTRYPAWDGLAQAMAKPGKIDPPLIAVRQQDWMPGFASLVENEDGSATIGGEAQVLLNLGAILAGVELGTTDKSEAQFVVADCLVHELMHVIENWTKAEFGEVAIERLLERYRKAASTDDEESP